MPQHGIQSVTVPGAVDGWQKLLDRFGKKKFPEVLAPAIRTAEDGFPVTEWIAATLERRRRLAARERRRRADLSSADRATGHRADCFAIPIWRGRCA